VFVKVDGRAIVMVVEGDESPLLAESVYNQVAGDAPRPGPKSGRFAALV
jgi:hypothetical protein